MKSPHLYGISITKIAEGDMAQGWQFATRSHRSGNPTWLFFRGVICSHAFGELRSQHIHVVSLVGHLVFGKVYGCAIKRIRLDYVAAHIEKTCVDLFNCIGPRDEHVLVAAFKAWSTKVVERKVLDLQVGPHRAIENDDAFFKCFEKIRH